MEKPEVDQWLRDYVGAWQSFDPGQIGALFAEDVAYRYHPYDEPVRGRAAVVRSWLGDDDNPDVSARDAPGTFDAAYQAVAVDGEVAVAVGSSSYQSEPGGPVVKVFDNCFLLRFDSAGLCREFTEWYMQRPRA